MTHNTPDGRKALCEKIPRFLVIKPFYQNAVAQTIPKLFPDRIVYDDEKDICSMLFEAVLFEDNHTGTTPFSYFVDNAPLSADEKRLYKAWRTYTRYEFFVVEKVTPGKELYVTDLIIARIVPFLKGWMITTEVVVSFSGGEVREQLKKSYGVTIPQFTFVHKYHEDRKRRMAS
jgi:hypothetical protein